MLTEPGYFIFGSVLSLFIAVFLLGRMFSSKNALPVKGRTVLITGASQGMGLSTARILSSKGANVIIVARNKIKLEQAMKEVSAAALTPGTQRFHTISADVTSAAVNESVMAEATKWNQGSPPDIVWAMAGAAVPGLFLDTTPETLRAQMDVNYWSAAFLAQSAMRVWLASSPSLPTGSKSTVPAARHLIMTSSTAAFVSVGGYSPYSPSKAAIRSLHDQLDSELCMYNGAFAEERRNGRDAPPDIIIHTVFPGTMTTPGLDLENRSKHQITEILEEGDPRQTPDEAATVAISALEKGRKMITTQGLLSEAMLSSSWQGSQRDRPVLNALLGCLMSFVWLFISWDMRKKVWNWGAKNGLPPHTAKP